MRMRRIAKIIVILTVLILIFFSIYSWVPGVRATVDNTVGPSVVGLGGAVANTVAPLYGYYIAPWPNHAIVWVSVAFIFAWIFHKGFNRVRNVFVASADAESGRKIIMKEPIQSVGTPVPTPVTPEEKKEETA